MMTLEIALDAANQLPLEQREMLEQILQRQRIEEWRRQLAKDAHEATQVFHAGQYSPMTADEVMASLRADLAAKVGE